jgi:hypothetical protein
MRKITKRDLLFFFLGIFAYFIFETIYSWESAKASFMKGYNETRNEIVKPEGSQE